MNCKKDIIRISAIVIAAILLFINCETKVEGKLENSGRVSIKIETSLGTQIASILRKSGAGAQNLPIIDAALINNSLKENKFIEKTSWTQNGPLAVRGEIVIKKVEDILPKNSNKATADFIFWKQNEAGGSVRININRKNGQAILELLSSELVDYLSAVMAPIATGEDISKQEYFELVGSVYNAALSKEIESARFSLRLILPNGQQTIFNTALVDILVLEKPVIYEASW